MLARRFITDSFLRVIFPLLLAWIDHGVGEIASECSDHLDHPSSGDPGGWVAPIAKAHAGSVECMMGNSAGGSDGGGGGGSGSVCEDEERSSRPRILREDVVATELDAASRVQVDAAGAVSGEVFDYLGEWAITSCVSCVLHSSVASCVFLLQAKIVSEAGKSFGCLCQPLHPAYVLSVSAVSAGNCCVYEAPRTSKFCASETGRLMDDWLIHHGLSASVPYSLSKCYPYRNTSSLSPHNCPHPRS